MKLIQELLAEMIQDTRTNAIPDVLPSYPADVEWSRDHIAHILNALTKADKTLTEREWCDYLRNREKEPEMERDRR